MWYKFFKIFIFRPLVRFGFRARIHGAENVPANGGAILVSNHIATMDPVIIPAMLPRKVTFPAKAELFDGSKNLGRAIVAWFLKAIGMVPMDRGGGRAAAREGLDGGDSSHRYGDDRHDARLLQDGPAPSSDAGRGRLSGADPAQRPRGRAGGPRSWPPRRRVRQPGSLVMSLLVCCRLVM